ncbi:hypothetical protein [Litoreibacter roseus]|uniref:Rap1a immunity protein domain-containing protein n=1 Tax=Litoreibacter roseus TaxID=2601869 RepID=A0A6N6JP72_9RHOB|nr:hypothetical protein [Litoreibacter roseus]GFE67272.1 hypothetical protein KIN_43460 [Litoreibacter roseus]
MIRSFTAPCAAITFAWLPLVFSTQISQAEFNSMAQPAENLTECRAPRPPKALADTAYIRNGYRAILQILAAERWEETGDCTCHLREFTWQDVVEQSQEFVTSDNPRLPFDVVALNNRATKAEAARSAACKTN